MVSAQAHAARVSSAMTASAAAGMARGRCKLLPMVTCGFSMLPSIMKLVCAASRARQEASLRTAWRAAAREHGLAAARQAQHNKHLSLACLARDSLEDRMPSIVRGMEQ